MVIIDHENLQLGGVSKGIKELEIERSRRREKIITKNQVGKVFQVVDHRYGAVKIIVSKVNVLKM